MGFAVVFVDAVGADVPAAVVAAGNLFVTTIAEQRAYPMETVVHAR